MVARISLAAGLVIAAIAAGFLLHWPLVAAQWPFSSYGLAHVFVASIFAAISPPLIWIGITGEVAALRSGALDIAVMALIIVIGLWGQAVAGDPSVLRFILLSAVWIGAAPLLFVWARRQPWRDARAMPVAVRIAFAVFAIVLLIVGSATLAGLPVLPWPADGPVGIVYGAFYCGAAVYFASGLVEPKWSNAKGQLLGFLVYDIVLLPPFVAAWPEVSGIRFVSLFVYIFVLIASAALAIWFVLLSPRWRLGSGR